MKKRRFNFAVVATGGFLPPVEWFALVDQRIRTLTVQEALVLGQLRDGLPDKLIADRLGVSVAAVRFHLRRASRKIGCQSRLEAALWADRNFFPPGFVRALVAITSDR